MPTYIYKRLRKSWTKLQKLENRDIKFWKYKNRRWAGENVSNNSDRKRDTRMLGGENKFMSKEMWHGSFRNSCLETVNLNRQFLGIIPWVYIICGFYQQSLSHPHHGGLWIAPQYSELIYKQARDQFLNQRRRDLVSVESGLHL